MKVSSLLTLKSNTKRVVLVDNKPGSHRTAFSHSLRLLASIITCKNALLGHFTEAF